MPSSANPFSTILYSGPKEIYNDVLDSTVTSVIMGGVSTNGVQLRYTLNGASYAPRLVFTVHDADPITFQPLLNGQSISTEVISGPGTGEISLCYVSSYVILVSWTIDGSFSNAVLSVLQFDSTAIEGTGNVNNPSKGIVTVQGNLNAVPVPVTGDISIDNPSVGLIGVVAPTSGTIIAGVNPSGNLQDLKLNANGDLLVAGNLTVISQTFTLNSQKDPNTELQTNNLTNSGLTGPQTALFNTCLYYSLGGEYWLKSTPGNENFLGVFNYQVPSDYSLYITDIVLSAPVVTQQFSGAAGQMWEICIGDGDNPNTVTGVRFPLTVFGITRGQREGTVLNGGNTIRFFITKSGNSSTKSKFINMLQGSWNGLNNGPI